MVIFVGKATAATVIGALQALLLLVIASLVPSLDLAWQYSVAVGALLTLLAVLLLSSFLAVLAQVLASRISTIQGLHPLMNLILFPVLFFSGAFFPLEDLPRWLQVLAILNPLAYAVDLIRLAIYVQKRHFLGASSRPAHPTRPWPPAAAAGRQYAGPILFKLSTRFQQRRSGQGGRILPKLVIA